jgi:hypothetical protein
MTHMLINLYDDPDGEPFATDVDLAEAFPDPDEYRAALNALNLQGQYWTGGGAAPAIFVKSTDRGNP